MGPLGLKRLCSTDNTFIRFTRGAFAILCFLGILTLVCSAAIFQPLQRSALPNIKTSKLPLPLGDLYSTLQTALGYSSVLMRIIVMGLTVSAYFYKPCCSYKCLFVARIGLTRISTNPERKYQRHFNQQL